MKVRAESLLAFQHNLIEKIADLNQILISTQFIDLSLLIEANNSLLIKDDVVIGCFLKQDDLVFLQLNSDAPTMVLHGSPTSMHLIVNAVNDLKLQDIAVLAREISVKAANIFVTGTVVGSKVALEARESTDISGSIDAGILEITANVLQHAGLLSCNDSCILESKQMQVVGQLRANRLEVICHQQLSLASTGRIHVDQDTAILSPQMILAGPTYFGAAFFCKANQLTIANSLGINNVIYIQCAQLNLIDNASINCEHYYEQSNILVHKDLLIETSTQISIKNLLIEAEGVTSKGNTCFNQVELLTDRLNLFGSFGYEFHQCELQINGPLLLDSPAKVFAKDTFFNSNSIYFEGRGTVANCQLATENCVLSAGMHLTESKLTVSIYLKEQGATITNCDIGAEEASLYHETRMKSSRLQTNILHNHSTGLIEESNIVINKLLYGTEDSKLTFKHSYLATQSSYNLGHLNLTDGSFYQSNYHQQEKQSLTVNGSQITNNNMIYSTPNAQIIAENGSSFKVQKALLASKNQWRESDIQAEGTLIFNGENTGLHVGISSKKSIMLLEHAQNFVASTVDSGEQIINTGAISANNKSKISTAKFRAFGESKFLNGSQLTAAELEILGQFKLHASELKAGILHARNPGILELKESELEVEHMNVDGVLQVEFSDLHAISDIAFAAYSQAHLHHVQIKADGELNAATHSHINGTELNIQTPHFNNAGQIALDTLSVAAQQITNSGQIEVDKKAQYRALYNMTNSGRLTAKELEIQSLSLINHGTGLIHSEKNTLIQAPLIINFMGDIASGGRLTVDSLLQFNLFASERAYDLNKRSLVGINAGLMIPHLPCSWEEVFHYQRLFSMGRMMFLQAFPQYANSLSLAFLAKKVLVNAGLSIMESLYSSQRFAEVPVKIYHAALGAFNSSLEMQQYRLNDASDVLPVSLRFMDNALTLSQWKNSILDASQEWSGTKFYAGTGSSGDWSDMLGDLTVTTFAPSYTSHSYYEQNAGLNFNANIAQNSRKSSQSGLFMGWNVSQRTQKGSNRGILMGANLNMAANDYINTGELTVTKKSFLNVQEHFINQEGAQFAGTNVHMVASQIDNFGTMFLNENARFQADKIFNQGTYSYTGKLQFEAGKFALGAQASLLSGDPQADNPNHLYIHAKKATLEGKIKADNATIDAQELDEVDEFLTQQGAAVQQTFTGSLTLNTRQKVTLNTSVARDCDLTICASEIEVNHEQKSQYDRNLKTTQQSLVLRKDIHAKNIQLESAQDVAIHGATIQAAEAISMVAGKKVKLKSLKKEYKGEFDTEVEYTQPKLIANADNTGEIPHDVQVLAQDKLVIDGALIKAKGDAILEGKKGIEIHAEAHTYVNHEEKKKRKALGITYGSNTVQHKKTRTNVSDVEAGKKIILVAEEGQVKGVAGKFSSGSGTQIHAQKDIELKGLKTLSETRKQKTSFFGLNKKKDTERHEGVELVEFIATDGPTQIFANQGDIKAHDIRFKGKGDLTLAAPAGSIEVENSSLKHLLETKERSFRFGSPMVDAAKKWSQPDKVLKTVTTSINNTVQSLTHSEDPLAQLTTAVDTGIIAHNSLDLLQENKTPTQWLETAGFVPKVNLTHTQSKTHLNYETLSAGEIDHKGTVSFVAKEEIYLHGVPMNANNLYLEAKNVRIAGQKLDFNLETQTQSVQLGLGMKGAVDVSGAKAQQKVHKRQVENAVVVVNNNVTINADNCQLQAANITCNTVNGQINYLAVESKQSELQATAQNTSASTTGNVGIHDSKTQALNVVQNAGIHVRTDINADEFKVGSAQLVGAAVTADGYNGFAPEELQVDDLYNYTDTQSYGFSGNLVEAAKILSEPAVNAENEAQSRSLHTVNLAHAKEKYRSVSRATIFGKQGVSTAIRHHEAVNSNSHLVHQELEHQQRQFNLNIPVEWVRSLLSVNQETKSLETVTNMNYVSQDSESEEGICGMELDDDASATLEPNPAVLAETGMEIDEERESLADEHMHEADSLANGFFDPKVKANELGFKRGSSGKSKLYRTNNGQYTSAKKELLVSAKNSPSVTGDVRLKLSDSGDSGEGLFYQAQLDSKNKKLRVNVELGKQYTFNLTNEFAELGELGQAACSIDAGSLGALLKAKADSNALGIKLMLQAEAGVMGPSVSASFESSTLSIMGLQLGIKIEGAGGVGFKAQGGAGFTADGKKAQVKAHAKLGIFSGLGAHGQVNLHLGLDPEFSRSIERAMQEIVSKDAIGLHLIEKMKKQEILHGWEVDYFSDMMDQVSARAQAERWLGNQ